SNLPRFYPSSAAIAVKGICVLTLLLAKQTHSHELVAPGVIVQLYPDPSMARLAVALSSGACAGVRSLAQLLAAFAYRFGPLPPPATGERMGALPRTIRRDGVCAL